MAPSDCPFSYGMNPGRHRRCVLRPEQLGASAGAVPVFRRHKRLFYGMDFSGVARPRPFPLPGFGFVCALLLLSDWALFSETFFARLRRRLVG